MVEFSEMLLPLPLLVPLLITVGWEAVQPGFAVRDRESFSAAQPTLSLSHFLMVSGRGGSTGLPCQQGDCFLEDCGSVSLSGESVRADSDTDLHAALSLWTQDPSGDVPASTDKIAVQGFAVSGSSTAWAAANLLEMEDRPRDQSVRIALAGPVFLFGHAEKDNFAPSQASRFVGHTGLTCKLPIQEGFELRLSCGPELTYTDTLPSDRLQDHPPLPFQRRLLRVDVQCRWRLLRQVGLECQGSVCPALNPGEQDAFHQDLHLAFPLTGSGRFNLGAKYSWDRSPDIKLGPESGQVYGDFRLIW
jgi:hypothetical protein